MELAAWEASVLFALWGIQFAFSPVPPDTPVIGYFARHIHRWVTWAYLLWAAAEIVRMVVGRRKPVAFQAFAEIWRKRVLGRAA